MPPPSGAQHAAPAFRIYQGDTILGVGWSNVAANMDGFFRVVYDDGEPETIRWDRTVATSARAAFLITSAQVARKDGFVTEGVMFGDAPQRGQTYLVTYIAQGYQAGDVRSVLAKGYVYASTPLQIGQQVEPGPAGGPGAITRVTKVATAVPAPGLVLAVVPTGATWRFFGGLATWVATATAGTRSVKIRFRDASGNVYFPSLNVAPIATQTSTLEFAPNITTDGTALLSGNSSIEFPSPDRAIPAGYDVLVIDTAGIDVTDTCALESQVEEWVMPN